MVSAPSSLNCSKTGKDKPNDRDKPAERFLQSPIKHASYSEVIIIKILRIEAKSLELTLSSWCPCRACRGSLLRSREPEHE